MMRNSVSKVKLQRPAAAALSVALLGAATVQSAQITTQCGSPEISGATLFAATQGSPPIERGHCFKEYRVRGDMHFVSSYRFGAGDGKSREFFLSRDEEWLRNSIRDHIENDLGWLNGEELTYSGIVVADIEHAGHIRNIVSFSSTELHQAGQQWSMCIRLLAEAFPCAEIGWAPIYSTPRNGSLTPNPERVELTGLVLGNYDFSDLDFIMPNVYPGFWVGDQLCQQPPLSTPGAVRDRYVAIATHAASALVGILNEADLYDPTFSSRVQPFANLAYRIYSGGDPRPGCEPSLWNGRFLAEPELDPTLEYTLLPQINTFANHGVTLVSFWSSRPELDDLGQGVPVHVDEYWSGLSCEFDYDGDGSRDFSDFMEWLGYYSSNGLCADLTGDGVVDAADFNRAMELADAGACD